jgi:hypothetical protein
MKRGGNCVRAGQSRLKTDVGEGLKGLTSYRRGLFAAQARQHPESSKHHPTPLTAGS